MGQQPQTAVDARPNWRDACLVVLDLAALSNMFLVLDHHGKAHPILGPKSGIRFPAGMNKASAARVAAEALFVAAHCVWVVEMSRFAPKEEGIDLRVMPDE